MPPETCFSSHGNKTISRYSSFRGRPCCAIKRSDHHITSFAKSHSVSGAVVGPVWFMN